MSCSTGDWFRKYFEKALDINSDEPKPESLLEEVTFEGIAKYINSDKCQKIVTMAGAGISTCKLIHVFDSYEKTFYCYTWFQTKGKKKHSITYFACLTKIKKKCLPNK